MPCNGSSGGLVCTCGWYSTRVDWEAAKQHILNAPGGIHDIVREAEQAPADPLPGTRKGC